MINVLPLQPNEIITSILTYDPTQTKTIKNRFIFMGTRAGTMKKTDLAAFANIKKSGIIAIKLEKEDKLQWALLTDGDNNVIVITHLGKAILFSEKDVRPMGRSSKGVIGIRLNKEDFVTSMDACPKTSLDRDLIVIGARGVGND